MTARNVKRLPVLVVVLVAVVGCASPSHPARRSSLSVAATAWRLVSVTSGGRTISLPELTRPPLDFGRDGSISLGDTLNALSGRYVVENGGVTVSKAGSTLVGYAGGDPDRSTTIAAVDSLVFGSSNGTSRSTTHFSASRSGDVLHIVSRRYELLYRAVGRYAGPAPASSTASNK